MILTKTAAVTIAAPREHVFDTLVRMDLGALRFYDARVESVETNGVPDGQAGQVARTLGRVWGQEVEIIHTLLVADRPSHLLDRMDMPGDSVLTDIRLTELPDGETQLTLAVSFEIAAWKVLKIAMTALGSGAQVRRSAARFGEFAELTFRAR